MTKSRRRLLAAQLVALALGAGACAGALGITLGPPRSRPPALAGEWVDSAKTVPGDTSIWVLEAGGSDGALRIRVDTSAGKSGKLLFERRTYGRWFMEGTLADTTARAFCVTRRPGRDAPSCTTFAMDTVTIEGRPRRRLVIHGYRGTHHTSDRVLLERSS